MRCEQLRSASTNAASSAIREHSHRLVLPRRPRPILVCRRRRRRDERPLLAESSQWGTMAGMLIRVRRGAPRIRGLALGRIRDHTTDLPPRCLDILLVLCGVCSRRDSGNPLSADSGLEDHQTRRWSCGRRWRAGSEQLGEGAEPGVPGCWEFEPVVVRMVGFRARICLSQVVAINILPPGAQPVCKML